MVFLMSLSDSKFHQISGTFLADLNNVVVWMVSAHHPSSNTPSPLTKPLGIVPSEPITIGITVTFIFRNFLFLW